MRWEQTRKARCPVSSTVFQEGSGCRIQHHRQANGMRTRTVDQPLHLPHLEITQVILMRTSFSGNRGEKGYHRMGLRKTRNTIDSPWGDSLQGEQKNVPWERACSQERDFFKWRSLCTLMGMKHSRICPHKIDHFDIGTLSSQGQVRRSRQEKLSSSFLPGRARWFFIAWHSRLLSARDGTGGITINQT